MTRHRCGEAATKARVAMLLLWAAVGALLHCAISPAAAASNIQPLPVATKINLSQCSTTDNRQTMHADCNRRGC